MDTEGTSREAPGQRDARVEGPETEGATHLPHTPACWPWPGPPCSRGTRLGPTAPKWQETSRHTANKAFWGVIFSTTPKWSLSLERLSIPVPQDQCHTSGPTPATRGLGPRRPCVPSVHPLHGDGVSLGSWPRAPLTMPGLRLRGNRQ